MIRCKQSQIELILIIVHLRKKIFVSSQGKDTSLVSLTFPSPFLGTEEERIAVETACRYGTKPNVYASTGTDDVCMEVRVEGEGPRMGSDANLKIVLKNQSEKPRKTTLHSQVAVMYYTGVLKDTVKSEKISVDLLPNEGKLDISNNNKKKS